MQKHETIHVENFLVVKKAQFDVKKINIIIGPQTNGKSLLAKLIYLFREVISESFLQSVSKNETKKEFLNQIDSLFNQYFPGYTWKDKSFSMEYNYHDIQIAICKESQKRKLSIDINETLLSLHRSLKSKFRKYKTNNKKEDRYGDIFWDFRRNIILEDEELSKYFNEAIFIPASRSFFANLQKNIFSFLSENIDIDPFMKNFGSRYEFSKKIYNDLQSRRKELLEDEVYIKISTLVEKILNGKYTFKDDQDWISKNGELTNLANASSGQQESLPMLLILSVFPLLIHRKTDNIYFLEEPEAHLFPVSQKHIVSLIAIMYNFTHSIVITTHSPYILSAINNFILAKDTLSDTNQKELYKLVDKDMLIDIDDVSAYTIENGVLKSIVDSENRLIGMNIIDSVSDDFSKTFDDLLALGMEP